MLVTEFGIVKEVRPQPEKAPSPIVVTELGIIVFMHPAMSVLVSVSMIALQLLRESYFVLPLSTDIEVNPLQPAKAPLPMFVTVFCIVIDVRPLQPTKAPLPMLVTVFGITVFLQPAMSVLVSVSMIALQLLREL